MSRRDPHPAKLHAATLCCVLAAVSCAANPPRPTAKPAEPSVAIRYLQSGDYYAQRGDLLRAEQYFASAVNAGYPERSALPKLVRACLAGGRVRAAFGHVEAHLAHDPADTAAHYLAASLQLALGRPALAREELRTVLSAQPRHAGAHYLLATLSHDWLRDPRAAVAELQLYLKLAPAGPHAAQAHAWLASLRLAHRHRPWRQP